MNSFIDRCKNGDKDGLNLFYKKYADCVFRVCLRYIGEETEAEDMVSEIFIKAFNKIGSGKFENENMLGAWVKKIAVNECLMKLRKKIRIVMVEEVEAIQEEASFNIHSDIEVNYLLSIIQSLPIGYRTVFNLYALEGYTHKEISEQLGISIGTSKSQLNKARTQLQAKLKTR